MRWYGQPVEWGKRAHAVAGFAAVTAALVAGLLSSSASAATTPNLTGSWYNVAAPTAPDWALQTSANLSQLSASWNGSAAFGHAGLVGDANGLILNLARTAYSGRYDIKEGGFDSPGDMTITIVSANQITINFVADSGNVSTLTFKRAFGSVVPPAISWCTSATPAAAHVAACTGGLTNPIPLPSGGEAIEPTPDLTAGQDAATISVSVSGDSAANVDGAVAPQQSPSTPHFAICVTIAKAKIKEEGPDIAATNPELLLNGVAITFVDYLLACVQELKIQQELASKAARAAAALPCPQAFGITITHTTSTSISFTAKRSRVTPPVLVTCKRTTTGLTMHVQTRSPHTSLKSLFGSRLLFGVYHSAKATQFATVTAAFSNH